MDSCPRVESRPRSMEEQECKICFSHFDRGKRKVRVLPCGHRVCDECLQRLRRSGDNMVVSCPFCRSETHMPERKSWVVEEEHHLLPLLGAELQREVLLSPRRLSTGGDDHSSSDCLVLTIVALPESPSCQSVNRLHLSDPLPCFLPAMKSPSWMPRTVTRCLLGTLCLVYLCSLPLGIYLLMVGRPAMGVALVSLVPASLLLFIVAGFLRCLHQRMLEILAERRHVAITTRHTLP
ncbi:E3 ubiquitin-protein ligase RNF182 isoform X1 [Synchiropus splendidus]|uniref:E3 ubiquitin-protein ligase RNF182 isoform X1 n=2 Tax=Synchiropus splendidus TaxID=270530 RepID=UPI00237DB583|nr:E3 ubiquitin-protein ligase RNF182 isoform X1 [Synchiropus splendidus]